MSAVSPSLSLFKEQLISSQVQDSSVGCIEEQEVKAGQTARL